MFSASFESFTCQTHSLALPVENTELKCKQECIQVPSAAVAISGGGGSSEREVSAEGGFCWGGGGCPGGQVSVGVCGVHLPHPVDRQTAVQTLPFRNYCCEQ